MKGVIQDPLGPALAGGRTGNRAGGGPGGQDGTGAPSAERLLALSDGVIAIALTLLVLQLAVPAVRTVSDPGSPRALWDAMFGSGWSHLVSYLISYVTIGGFWLLHHRTFRDIEGHSTGLAWANLGFLLAVSLMPFTSELLGEFPENPLGVSAFALNMILIALATLVIRYFASRHGLLAQPAAVRPDLIRIAAFIAICALSIALAWLWDSRSAVACWALLLVLPEWAAVNLARRPGG